MAAVLFNFVNDGCRGTALEVGANFAYEFIWEVETPPDSEIFIPVSLDGYSAKMQVRKSPGSPVILELSTDNTRISFDSTNGIIKLQVPPNVTAILPAGVYRYDLDLRDANGFVTRFVQGEFQIVAGITV